MQRLVRAPVISVTARFDPLTNGSNGPILLVRGTNPKENEMRTILREKQTGTRKLAGTDWPIVDQLHREQMSGKASWVITRGLCNGIPDKAETFKTKKEALAAF